MQMVDSKEDVMRGVERLQAMATPTTNFGLSVDLTMAVSSRSDDRCVRSNPPVHEFLPLHPLTQRVLPSSQATSSPADSALLWHTQPTGQATRGIDVNQIPSTADCDDVAVSSLCTFSAFRIGPVRKVEDGVKREREKTSELDFERTCDVTSRISDEEEAGQTRKKLRLSKEQSALLEESFKEHSTLNPKQKGALAKQLNLRPRQVEVWFQNRRARTKLKQTEVDCELLKRCCESLTEENRRLQKELHELRAIKVAPPCVIAHDYYMPLPAATLTMCPSCERLATMDNRAIGLAKPQLQQFSQPSAAC
eukprot:c17087_g1_i1 orf=224-1147(-)